MRWRKQKSAYDTSVHITPFPLLTWSSPLSAKVFLAMKYPRPTAYKLNQACIMELSLLACSSGEVPPVAMTLAVMKTANADSLTHSPL
jgi:hypothetical protein